MSLVMIKFRCSEVFEAKLVKNIFVFSMPVVLYLTLHLFVYDLSNGSIGSLSLCCVQFCVSLAFYFINKYQPVITLTDQTDRQQTDTLD